MQLRRKDARIPYKPEFFLLSFRNYKRVASVTTMISYILNSSTRSSNKSYSHNYFFITGVFIHCLPDIKQITTIRSEQSRFLTSTIKKTKNGAENRPTLYSQLTCVFATNIFAGITHKAKFRNFLNERPRPYTLDMAEDQNFPTFVSGTG